MEVLTVNQSEVSQLLRMKECIEVVKEALGALALGKGIGTLVELGGRREA